jgi:hypothetical protein
MIGRMVSTIALIARLYAGPWKILSSLIAGTSPIERGAAWIHGAKDHRYLLSCPTVNMNGENDDHIWASVPEHKVPVRECETPYYFYDRVELFHHR